MVEIILGWSDFGCSGVGVGVGEGDSEGLFPLHKTKAIIKIIGITINNFFIDIG